MRHQTAPENLAEIEKAVETCSSDWKTYECTLVTPMYGGGVKPGEVDAEMPIRTSAIRGQLRFWWRILCAQGLSAREMFKRESEIWGGIGDEVTASKVEVRIIGKPAGPANLASSADEGHLAIKYAFGSAAINGPRDWLQPDYSFQLGLRYPDEVAAEVEVALAWWGTFGGVGARTRRGFGAVRVAGLASVSVAGVEEKKGRLCVGGSGSAEADVEWKTAVDRLFSFRQKGGTARKAGSPRPGRSFWPEPDQIRRFTGKYLRDHEPVHKAENVFPRAAFGLPITFKFYSPAPENYAVELHPEGDSDRMASPLILRPYWNGEKWQPAALLLPGWENALEQRLKFKDQHYRPEHWPTDSSERKKLASAISPMAGRADDPLSAFMDFFEKGK